MNILGKLGIVFGVCLIGEAVSQILPIPFPGSVVSMILLLLLLLTGVLKTRHIEEPTQFFLSNLVFFLVPAGVSVIQYLDLIRDNLVFILAVNIGTTILTFAATAYTIKLVIHLQRRFGKKVS